MIPELGVATGRFGDARFFTSCEKATPFVGALDILSSRLHQTPRTIPPQRLAPSSSVFVGEAHPCPRPTQ